MTFTDLESEEKLIEFLNNNETCIVVFSATWCGPCKASKPKVQIMANESPVPFGYVYESDLEDFLHVFIKIKAFPTHVCFKNGQEVQRVEGANMEALEEMVSAKKA